MNKFIYLISPNNINNEFYVNLNKVLSYGNVKFFQLRLKNKNKLDIIKISKKIKRITKRYNVKFILNDDYNLALIIKADGCHMGQRDGSLAAARKKLKNAILGITCHNSITLAEKAIKNNPAFFKLGSR